MTDNLVEAVARAIFRHSDIGRLNPNMEPASMMKSDLDRQARSAVETVFEALIAETERMASLDRGASSVAETNSIVWSNRSNWLRAKKAEVMG